jgi:DinB family protein
MAQHSAIAATYKSARAEDLPKLIVRRQLNRSGNTLLAALEPLQDQDFFGPGPAGVSAAWTLGHLACVADLFGAALDDGQLALHEDTHAVFNALDLGVKKLLSKAEGVCQKDYPKSRLLLMMRQTQVRLLKLLDAFDVQRWDEPAPDRLADTLPTYGSVWEHLAVHTYWHLGELSNAVPRFHGTYSMNTMLHYFTWGENDTEAARRASSAPPIHSMVVPKSAVQ